MVKSTCCALLVEDLGSVPSTQRVAHNYLYLQFGGIQDFLLTSADTRRAFGKHIYIYIHAGKNTWTYKNQNIFKKQAHFL